MVNDQNFRRREGGGRSGGWGRWSHRERCLKGGGGGCWFIKKSFQKHLGIGVGKGKSCS